MEISEVDIPEAMIEDQLNEEVKQFDVRLRNQGLELQKYLELTGSNMDELRTQLKPAAQQRVNADLVLEAVAEAEDIEVSDEDVDKELEKLAQQYSAEDTEGFIEDMKRGDLEFLKTGIANNKAIEFLLENAKFI